MFVVEEFVSTYKMSEWVSRQRNMVELKRKYPPSKGYKIYLNLVEKKVEVHDEEVTVFRPEDEFYNQIKKQAEEQLTGVTIFLDEDTGIIIGEKRRQPSRKIPVGVLPKKNLKQLIEQLGEERAINDTLDYIVPEVVKACNRIFNSK